MAKEITRRDFLKNSAIATATIAASSILGGCAIKDNKLQVEPSTVGKEGKGIYPENDICGKLSMSEFNNSLAVAEAIKKFDEEENYDVIVVGAGVSGMPAAIAAYESGASVCVLQKESFAMGQGSVSFILDKERSGEFGKIGLVHEMRKYCNYRSNFNLNLAWADNCTDAMNWFIEKMEQSGLSKGTDYNTFPTDEFQFEDGTAYGSLCACTNTYTESIKALGEHFSEKFPIYFKTPAIQLIKENDKVIGVFAKKEDGTILKVTANKGVILATGDYQNNDAMVNKYVPDAAKFSKKQVGKTGDGHLMGMAIGAKMENTTHTKMIHTKSFGKCSALMKSLPFLAVNKNGNRFVSEDIPYDLRNNFVKDQPEMCWIAIFDSNYETQYSNMGFNPKGVGYSINTPDTILEEQDKDKGAYVADTLEELAAKMEVLAEELIKSVNRYNELCTNGIDLDFGKPSKYLAPITQGPFYALRYEYSVSAITSGLEVNVDCEVLDESYNPIRGLYAVGNCSGPFYGSIDYPLDIPGLSISYAITSGYRAGNIVAKL